MLNGSMAQRLSGRDVIAEVVRVYGDGGIAHPLAHLSSRGKGGDLMSN